MGQAQAEWDSPNVGRSTRPVVGAVAALTLCEEIEAAGADHLLISFISSGGAFFGIGLGALDSCVVFWESGDPPYFQSRGHHLAGAGPVTYWYGGQASEMPATVRIARSEAFAALQEFMLTGRRPEHIEWDET